MALFFGLYWLLLRKEKLFIFNRYYLIFSVLFSLAVPFVSIPFDFGYEKMSRDIATVFNNKPEVIHFQNETGQVHQIETMSAQSESNSPSQTALNIPPVPNIMKILLCIYLLGFVLMLIRFLRNISLVTRMLREAEKINQEWYRIALIDNTVNPFSFLRTIFINKQDYLENRISSNVLRHELEHVRQSHSRDVIFFEILHIIFWFNPVLFLYKRAARINHEYLADEAVIRSSADTKTYANELINFISVRIGIPFTSGFSPSMIRRRLLMLNTSTNRFAKFLKILVTLSSSGLMFIILGMKPAFPDSKDYNKLYQEFNTVVDQVYFRDRHFFPSNALVVVNDKILGSGDVYELDLHQIKNMSILKDNAAKKKYGRKAKDGAVEISLYDNSSSDKFIPDSSKFKTLFHVDYLYPHDSIHVRVSDLYSVSLFTYPFTADQANKKNLRIVTIMTRDFYKVRGQVQLKNGKPFPDVLVSATDNPLKVKTDKDGNFLISDVREGSMLEFSSEGYEPCYVSVSTVVFTTFLNVTLYKKNDPENKNNIAISYSIKDFSGTWKFNKELSKTWLPAEGDSIIDIHQYQADSLIMNVSISPENNIPLKRTERYVFNTVRTLVDKQNKKHVISCSIENRGQNFKVTERVTYYKEDKLIEYERIYNYSLSDDGKRLLIKVDDTMPETSLAPEKEIHDIWVYDRI